MSSTEKFCEIIRFIDSLITQDTIPSKEIITRTSEKFALSERTLSEMFQCLSEKPIRKYIKDKKMNQAYLHLIHSSSFDINTAIQISESYDQSAFSKRFKELYHMTPKEAWKKKDISIIDCADNISKQPASPFASRSTVANGFFSESNQICGIDKAKYEEMKQFINLQNKFCFDNLQTNAAYYLFSQYAVKLYDAFRFVDDEVFHYEKLYQEFKDEFDEEMFSFLVKKYSLQSKPVFFDQYVKKTIDNFELRHIYFNLESISISEAIDSIQKLHDAGVADITKQDLRTIELCAFTEMDPGYCIRAVNYFNENATAEYGEDAFEEYVQYLLEWHPIEDAFAEITNFEGWDEYPAVTIDELRFDAEIVEQYEQFDKWAAEETNYTYEENDEEHYSWERIDERIAEENEEIEYGDREDEDDDWN